VPDALPLTELKVGAVINTSSGGCDLESEEKMLRILKRARIVEPSAWCGKATEMERFFSGAAGQKLDVFIVLGGDGTIRRAAEACAEMASFLIPLPGGIASSRCH
jgi:diacylglycerol kinase family enzyme